MTVPVELPADIRQRVFVVVPAYNEGVCIEDVLREVLTSYPNVVVVDDGSTDQTYQVAREIAPYVLRHVVNRGQGAALQTGIEFAMLKGAEYVVSFDSDGQHRVEDIAALVAPIASGECDITLGSRFLGQALRMPPGRRVLLQLGVIFTRVVNRMPLTDTHNGLRAFSRRAAQGIDISMDRMAHATELIDMIRRSQMPYREVPVQIRYTRHSLSKHRSLGDALRIALHYFAGRASR